MIYVDMDLMKKLYEAAVTMPKKHLWKPLNIEQE